MFKEDHLDSLDIKKDIKKIRKEKEKRLFHRNDPQDETWWPIFWEKRFKPEMDNGKIPQRPVVLDFCSQNYCQELPYSGMELCVFDFPQKWDGKIPHPDNTFDAIISHGNLNKDPRMNPGSLHKKNVELVMTKRVRKRIAESEKYGEYQGISKKSYESRLVEELPSKAWCFMGGSHVLGVPWMVREKVIQRWRELYRVSKDGAVWFITCLRHGRFHRWAERILTDEDRQEKTIHIVNF
jgi:hypothetical protein